MIALGIMLLVLCLLFLVVILIRQAPQDQRPESNKAEEKERAK